MRKVKSFLDDGSDSEEETTVFCKSFIIYLGDARRRPMKRV